MNWIKCKTGTVLKEIRKEWEMSLIQLEQLKLVQMCICGPQLELGSWQDQGLPSWIKLSLYLKRRTWILGFRQESQTQEDLTKRSAHGESASRLHCSFLSEPTEHEKETSPELFVSRRSLGASSEWYRQKWDRTPTLPVALYTCCFWGSFSSSQMLPFLRNSPIFHVEINWCLLYERKYYWFLALWQYLGHSGLYKKIQCLLLGYELTSVTVMKISY